MSVSSSKQGDVLLNLVRNAASWLLFTDNAAVAVMDTKKYCHVRTMLV